MGKINDSKTRKAVLLVLTLSWMGVIFWFSSKSHGESHSMSGKVLMRLLEIIPIRRVMKGVSVNVLRRRFHMAFRKFAHFTEFSILSALLTTLAHRYFPQYEKSRRVRVFLRTVLPVSLALGYAFFDELHQRGSAGRDSNLLDVLIDFSGICFGLLLVKTITFLHQKRKRKKAQTAEADRANHD